MAKRKESPGTASGTKTKIRKQGTNAIRKASGARADEDAGIVTTKEEKTLQRKVQPKLYSSSKSTRVSTSITSTSIIPSKYFQPLLKEEEETDDDDDFQTVAMKSPVVTVTTKEEKTLQRKVQPKLYSSSKSTRVSTSITSTSIIPSKYFQPLLKEEEETDDDDDFQTVVMKSPVVTADTVQPVIEKMEEGEEEESEEDDWEEVEELSEPLGPAEPSEPALPSQPVEIEIETPALQQRRLKKEKRKAEFEAYLRRMVNRFNKDLLMDTHKVHLLCLIANGMFRNRLCSEPDLLAITLSLLPAHFTMVSKKRIDQNYLSGLLKWFGATFTFNPSLPYEEHLDPRALLERRLASLSARNHQEMTHGKGAKGAGSPQGEKKPNTQKTSQKISPEPKASPGTKRPAAAGRSTGERGGKKAKKKDVKEDEEEEGERRIIVGGQKPKNAKRRSIASKVNYKEQSDSEGEEEEPSDGDEFQVTSEEESGEFEGRAKPKKGKKAKDKSKAKTKNCSKTAVKQENERVKKEDKDWEEEGEEAEEGKTRQRTNRRSGKQREGGGADEWLEVYLYKTATWVCVDVEHGVGQPQLCSRSATQPLTYVVSVDEEGHLKDLGKKYDPTWMTSSRKRRVDEDWWEETLEPFLGQEDERDKREDKELNAKLLDKPLPTSIAEYKNHPLYVLKRHLLKYEAIYPPTAAVLGYCRREAVYSRDCVHTLHSRDTWLKEARTVRLGEEPFKMVKGFSNRSRKARMMSEQKDENDLPLFGEWQTEEYQPPLAVDGKVPRNDYGNVYLFKPCMLPVGCVHLRLPNLHRVARKLDVDAAPAVTGFDFHGGYSHAVTDGYIVCEEHEEVLRAAWVEEQEIQKQREKEKREKRATSNWTLLVKGLLIRERLQQRYGKKNQGPVGAGASHQTHTQDVDGGGGLSSDDEDGESEGPRAKTAAETLAMSWPQNRQEEGDEASASGLKKKTSKREKRGQEKNLFPFERV